MFLKLRFSLLIILAIVLGRVNAQVQLTETNFLEINKLQDTLSNISDSTYKIKNDSERIIYNSFFVKKLISSLKTPFSFQHNFEALTNLSILKAPNNSFRIFSWYIPLSDGSYKFYGALQLGTKDGVLKLIPLNDATSSFTDDNEITNQKKWYGARYYEIVPVSMPGKSTYYMLLGWKGNNIKTTKKVIEILSVENEQAVFGRNVFEMQKNIAAKNRIVFEYSKNNSMSLFFDKNVNMLVFDHLAPYDETMKGNFEYYASDSSFDGYKISYNKFYLKENIPLKNDANAMDDFYATPRKATTVFLKGKQ